MFGKLGRLFLIVLVVYVGAYGWLRYTKEIVHVENKGGSEPHFVGAKTDPWQKMGAEMAEELVLGRSDGAWAETRTTILNALFWPLCTAESAVWKMRK